MDSRPHPHLPSESLRGGPRHLCFTRSLGDSVLRFKKLCSNLCFQKVTVAVCGAGKMEVGEQWDLGETSWWLGPGVGSSNQT